MIGLPLKTSKSIKLTPLVLVLHMNHMTPSSNKGMGINRKRGAKRVEEAKVVEDHKVVSSGFNINSELLW